MSIKVEKIFPQYSNLPAGVRSIIVDKMAAADRCRFSGLSKSCNEEARASKNWIYELRFYYNFNYIAIDVVYGKYEFNFERTQGFRLEFTDGPGAIFQKYTSLDFQRQWTVRYNGLVDLDKCILSKFIRQLKANQHIIKKLDIYGSSPRNNFLLQNIDFGLDCLSNLEQLSICGTIDYPQIFSKLRKPLKKLIIEEEGNIDLAQFPQIFQVENNLLWWNAKLNFQQFSQFSTKDVTIRIGKLTEKDIFIFIRSWQNGTIGKQIENYRFITRDSNFDKQKLLKLLRAKDDSEFIEIKHFKKAGRSGQIRFEHGLLRFSSGVVEDLRRFRF